MRWATPIAASGAGGRLSVMGMVAFAGPAVLSGFVYNGAVFILPAILAAELAIPLAAIGAVLTFTRVFDAVSDPIIGSLSDRHAHRGGDRRVWVMAGTVLTGLLAVPLMSLWMPPGAIFVAAIYSLFFLAWTVMEIPGSAWGASISHDPNDRTLLFTLKGAGWGLGMCLFMVAPYLPFAGRGEFSLGFLRTAGWAAATYGLVAAAVIWWFGPPALSSMGTVKRLGLGLVVRQTVTNRPFLLFISSFAALMLGLGIWGGVLFIVADGYFHLGSKTPLLFALGAPVSVVSTPLWYGIVRLVGQRAAWVGGVILAGAALLMAGFLPAEPNAFPALLALVLIYFATAQVGVVVVPAYLASIVDYTRLCHRADRAGLLYSVYAFTTKLASALGAGVGLSLLGLFGFDPVAGAVTPRAELGVIIVFGALPATLVMISSILALLNPLDSRRIRIIQRRLERVEARSVRDLTSCLNLQPSPGS